MSKCDCYHVADGRGYKYDQDTGKPIPYAYKHGVCLGTKEREDCKCEGDTARCDFYPHKRNENKNTDVTKGCFTCKRYREDVSVCKLLNCHRAYGQKELENKDFVTDAWEKAK